MQIIDADPARRIDLPGIGPCPRPVDIDARVTGFATLKSLRIYAFSQGQVIEGESEVDEVYLVPIGGAVAVSITGACPLEAVVGGAGPRAIYMTPGHAYRLTPQADVLVAYARAAAEGRVATHVVEGPSGAGAETLRFAVLNLTEGAALPRDGRGECLIYVIEGAITVAKVRVEATQTLALSGPAAVRADMPSRVLMVQV